MPCAVSDTDKDHIWAAHPIQEPVVDVRRSCGENLFVSLATQGLELAYEYSDITKLCHIRMEV